MTHIAWGALALLLLTVGFSSGKEFELTRVRAEIADSCDVAGHFTVKKRGFSCERVSK